MSQAPKTMPQKQRTTPRSARKSTMGVIGGISARSCRPAAATILQTQDRNVPAYEVFCQPLSILSSVIRVGRARQASTGVWGMAAGGAGSTACLAAGCARS